MESQDGAQAGRTRVRGAEALSQSAYAQVARHHGLKPDSVESFLQDARKAVPAKT